MGSRARRCLYLREHGDQLTKMAIVEGYDKRLLVGKVLVERAHRDSRDLRDPPCIRPVVALSFEHESRRLQDRLDRHLRAILCWQLTWVCGSIASHSAPHPFRRIREQLVRLYSLEPLTKVGEN